nr:uncharacterized protein ighd isoform X1 [Misgurnus anguillicaudatus]
MYTCNATHNSEEIKQNYDLCKDFSKPLVTVNKPHLREIIKASTVTASCVVEAPYNTQVSWFKNGSNVPNTKPPVKSPLSSRSQKIVSNQTFSTVDWLGHNIVCKATHPCFKAEEPVIKTVNIEKDPVVVIRRSFRGGSAVLECVVRDLPSGEVCITFQSGVVDFSQVSCADVASSENNQSLTTDFTIPKKHQKEGTTFTCKVHSSSKQWTSKPIGNIFDNPTIELSVVPSVGQSSLNYQKLICSGTGFDPKIKWLSNFNVTTDTAVDVTIGEDGRLKVYSEMLVPQQDWNQGVIFTCEITDQHNAINKSINICSAQDSSKPLIKVKKPHLREIMKEKTVTATCSVEAPNNTEVSWLVNGVRRSATKRETYKSPLSSRSQIIKSIQTFSREDWLGFKTIVCTATHPCFKVEEPVIEPVKIQKDPDVVIRRSFTGGSAVLECVVRDLPSGEVCITFQSGGADISQISCADVPSSENNRSLTTDFTIPSDHQKEGKTFTCKVHSSSKQWTSNPTGNIFDNPTIELSVVPSVGESSLNSQKLVCSGTGFDPKIKWLSNVNLTTDTAVDVTIGEDGRLKVYSEMLVPQQDWNQGVIFTCEITDQHNAINKSINICSAQDSSKPLIKVKKPHLREIMKEKTVTATCSVEAPNNTEVSWLVNGVRRSATKRETYKSPLSSRSQIIKSIQTFSREDWLGFKTIVCTATHPCFKVEEPVIKPVNIQKDPVVVIRRSFTGGSAVLECVVRDLPSGEVCITFQSDGADISQVSCADVASSENNQSLTTDFTIPKKHQSKGKTFTCKVHSSSKQWTSKPIGNIFDNPTIELSVVPGVGESSLNSQKLVCSGTGFDPKIKWLLNSNVKSGVAVDVTIGEDGRLKVYSEMLVPQQDWNQGVICEITDQHNNINKSINICSDLSKPLVTVKKPHLRDIIKESTVTASCVVEAPYNTQVSWFKNGSSVPNTKPPVKSPLSSRSQKIVSNQTFSTVDWLRDNIVCKATHPCFKVEEPVIKTVNIQKDPVVVIRRSFTGGSAVLECVVRDLPSGEVCITFQSGGADISQISCADVASSENNRSLTTDFTIPSEHQKEGTTFTCKVQSPSKQWSSKPTGNIFDNPTIELSVVPSVGELSLNSEKLVCSGTGFHPQIRWLSNFNVTSDTAVDVTIGEDGRLKVYSEMLVPQQDWNQGVIFTCEITDQHNAINKSINICSDLSKPLVTVKKPHLRDIIKESTVTASCVVEAPYNTQVSWLVNGSSANNTKPPVKSPLSSRSQKIVSNQTFSTVDWLRDNIVCKATHPCFKVEEPVIKTVNIQKDPHVVIRRSFTGGSAVLECVVRDLPSGEVCITFQSGVVDFSQVSCADVPSSENNQSLTTDFTIPSDHQKEGKTFTCKVHSPSKQWTSKPTGNIFDNPTIELSVVPSVGESSLNRPKLVCSGTGFHPQIRWLSNFNVTSDTAVDVTIGEDGRLKVYSEMLVPQQDWNQGVIFTCEITDQHNAINKSINICSVADWSSQMADVYLLGPSLSDVRSMTDISLTCLVIGHRIKDFTIQWKVDGHSSNRKPFLQQPQDHANGTQSMQSILKVPVSRWHAYSVFTCEAKPVCSEVTQGKNISKTRNPKEPTVRILKPSDSDLSGSQDASLLCSITGFFPSEIYVQWQLNGTQLDESRFTNSPVVAHTAAEDYSIYSALILSASQWMEGVYSCVVSHESSKNPITATLENLYASLIPSAPSAKLLQGSNELVCLAYGFSPSEISITWLLGLNELSNQSVLVTDPTKGPDGKFTIQSYLHLLPAEWAPGEVYRCRVTHITGTQLINISKPEILEEGIYMNENKDESITQESLEEAWKMACAFLVLFLFSLFYGCTVTMVRVKTA